MKVRIPKLEPRQLGLRVRREAHTQWLARIKPDAVVIRTALETAVGLEGKRRIVKAMLKQTPAGGTLAAVVRCCDHAEELARRLVLSGTPAEELGLINLTNKEIAALKPTLAEYLVSFNTYRAAKWPEESNPSLAFTRHVIGNYDFSDMRCTLDDGFKVSFVQVGLIWRNEAKAR